MFGAKLRVYHLTFYILSTLLAHAVEPVEADRLYKWVDETGGVHYTTDANHPNTVPAELPRLQRENIDANIQKLRDSTPATCDGHGGIDCAHGADTDGSVVCVDGFAHAILPFRLNCLEARLRSENFQITLRDGSSRPVNSSIRREKLRGVTGFHLTLRNASPVEAYGVTTRVVFPNKTEIQGQGPDKVEAFGLGEYTFVIEPVTLGGRTPSPDELSRVRYKTQCVNCTVVSAQAD